MPRVFTTEILFEGRKYRCMATIAEDHQPVPIRIRVFDAELYEILGGNTIDLKPGCSNCAAHPLYPSLLDCINEAVWRYLKV